MVASEGTRLLTGQHPDQVGLLVVHPKNPACPRAHAGKGWALIRVESLEGVAMFAQLVGLQHRPDGERFSAVLLGAEHRAAFTLEVA